MSTAGKVLTAMAILLILGWIVLIAKVADLNNNWGQQIDRLTADISRLEGELEATNLSIDQTRFDLVSSQERKDGELLVLRSQISKLNALDSIREESLKDVELQIQLVLDATKDAEAIKAKRIAEKAQTEQELTSVRTEVQGLQESVGSLVDQLSQLQSSFIATHEQNQQLIQRLKGTEAGTPRTRPASFIR